MRNQLLHVFRNTPFGREVFLQSIYFCKKMGVTLRIYIPKHPQFLMYFQNEVVTVDLDSSFLRSPKTARKHAQEIAEGAGVSFSFLEPKGFTASTLPDIPTDFAYMCCPRSISDLSKKIGLGHIGPRVRSIIKASPFPVLIPTPVYKEWKSVTVFFGGSQNAVNAFNLGQRIGEVTGFPLRLFTQGEGRDRSYYGNVLREHGLFDRIEKGDVEWLFFRKGEFRENLYEVPHDSLVVVGAYGHGVVKEVLFGSTMEEIQSVLPNNMVIVGPNYVQF